MITTCLQPFKQFTASMAMARRRDGDAMIEVLTMVNAELHNGGEMQRLCNCAGFVQFLHTRQLTVGSESHELGCYLLHIFTSLELVCIAHIYI